MRILGIGDKEDISQGGVIILNIFGVFFFLFLF